MHERSQWPAGTTQIPASHGLFQLQGKTIPSFLRIYNCLTLKLLASTLLQLQQQQKPYARLPEGLQRKVEQMH